MPSPINGSLGKTYFLKLIACFFLLLGNTQLVQAQENPRPNQEVEPATPETNKSPEPEEEEWYKKISLRGYVQVRYNRLLETNPNLRLDADKSVGENGGFLIRRARLVFSGHVHDRVFVYIQPDLASTPNGANSLHFAQIRDAYFDVALDKQKAYRVRVGQSKIPYGFENMQSSSNRLALDRADALNTAAPNERDLGVFFYWAPAKIRERFKDLGSDNLKGSGDYGMFGLGIYNGQTVNRSEANNSPHAIARFTYPLALKSGQIIEPGLQAYTGSYSIKSDQLSSTDIPGGNFIDRRVGATLVVYPQPWGFQTEYNIGEGPQYDAATNTIQVRNLKGGYAQTMYQLRLHNQILMPFVKMHYYEGGRKAELDARYSEVYETEFGVEWQPIPAIELVTQYTITDRTTRDGENPDNRQFGNLLRIQAQFNF